MFKRPRFYGPKYLYCSIFSYVSASSVLQLQLDTARPKSLSYFVPAFLQPNWVYAYSLSSSFHFLGPPLPLRLMREVLPTAEVAPLRIPHPASRHPTSRIPLVIVRRKILILIHSKMVPQQIERQDLEWNLRLLVSTLPALKIAAKRTLSNLRIRQFRAIKQPTGTWRSTLRQSRATDLMRSIF